jgi:hypothetical protein
VCARTRVSWRVGVVLRTYVRAHVRSGVVCACAVLLRQVTGVPAEWHVVGERHAECMRAQHMMTMVRSICV